MRQWGVIDHGGGWETQYCDVANGSVVVKVGDTVTTGQPIARLGLSGNTEYPHLHITTRQAGATVDAFASNLADGACAAGGAGEDLWRTDAASAMAYKPGAVLNAGFAAAPVTMEAMEVGGIPGPTTTSTALVAYVRAINLRGGDVQELVVKGPRGPRLPTGAASRQGSVHDVHGQARLAGQMGARRLLGDLHRSAGGERLWSRGLSP